MLRTAIDIGGTFTDFIVLDEESGSYQSGKVPTVTDEPADGVLQGLGQMVGDLGEVAFAVHGTTVGLNAFLQRRGARVLVAATKGTRDVYHIARGQRLTMYAMKYRKPAPLVPLHDIMEVSGRLDYQGQEIEPLSEADVAAIAARVREDEIDAVVVALLFSYLNPEHELRVAELLRAELPEIPISLSHQVAREWGEYERTSSAVMDAYIGGKVRGYLSRLEVDVKDRGLAPPLHLMQSNGGILTARGAQERPLQTLLSGPVGGVMGAALLAEQVGRPNLICGDMGGTSFDVALVVDGEPDVAPELDLEGLPVLMPAVMIHTIGAGGGSLGHIEAGGLRVGPQSAGAEPGPVCYGRGGTEPTVTDANLLLGRIDTEAFLKGDMSLDRDGAEAALGRVGEGLGLDATELAEGMLTVVNATMAQAIRTLTVEKGIEPRDFSLLAYGGAGPIHAAFIARELEIGEVIVPPFPGAFSAWGMLQAPMRHDVSRMFVGGIGEADGDDLERVYKELEAEAAEVLEREGVAESDMSFSRGAGLRYVGQDLTVEISLDGIAFGGEFHDAVATRFHEAHHTRFGHSSPGAPTEFVILRVVGLGEDEDVAAAAGDAPTAGSVDLAANRRQVIFDGKAEETAIVNRSELAIGATLVGPAIVNEPTATTIVPPGMSLEVHPSGSLILTVVD